MARRRVTIAECDLCGSTQDVKRVRVDVEDRTGRTADLCKVHSKPLTDFLDKIEESRPTRRSVAAMPVTPMSEVQAEAATARKRAASHKGIAAKAAKEADK